VKPDAFEKMRSILQREYDALHQPGKKVLKRKSESIQYIVVDVTESPINRPKKPKRVLFREKTAYAETRACPKVCVNEPLGILTSIPSSVFYGIGFCNSL
jgi:hypothetical protein